MGKMIVPGGQSVYIDYQNGSGAQLSSKLDILKGQPVSGWTHEASNSRATWHADWIEYRTHDDSIWLT
ncbi:MAG: hypothetical protein HQK92_06335 [Nitrospirae bacterium]|nr:hypothetical protein [Nitrospirota bacterium]